MRTDGEPKVHVPPEVNAACRARHAFAGRAVQHAHGGDVVIAQKAHHKVAFAEIIFPFLFAERAARLQRVQQQRPQTQKLRNFAEGEELAHQHADRVRMPPQHILRAVPAPREQHLPVLAADGLAAVRRCRTQQPVPVARLPNSSAAVRYSPVRSYQLPSRPQASACALCGRRANFRRSSCRSIWWQR